MKQPIRPIAFFAGDLHVAGGSERVVVFWSRFLQSQGYDVHLVDDHGGPSYFDPGTIPISSVLFETEASVRERPFLLFHRVWRTARWLWRRPATTVIFSKAMYLGIFPFLFFFPWTWKHRYVYYNFVHASHLRERFSRARLAVIARCLSLFIFLYEDAESAALFGEKLITLPNPAPFPPQETSPDLASRRVLSIGRLSPEKGLDLLIEAWALIEKNPELRDWSLRIVGDGPLREELQKLALKRNVKRIEWVKSVPEVGKELREASLFVMTSHTEGIPMVMLEAFAFGLPTVSTNHAGARELMHGELAHGIVSDRSPENFALRISQFLNDEALRVRAGRTAKEVILAAQPEARLGQWEKVLA